MRSLKNGSYYTGSAIDKNRRLVEHSTGLVKATKNLRPLEMVFFQEFADIKTARQVEYQIKKKKSKIIIEKIIKEGKIRFIENS